MSRLSWSCWTCRHRDRTSENPPRADRVVAFVHDVVHHHHTSVNDRRLALNVPSTASASPATATGWSSARQSAGERGEVSPDGSEIMVGVEDKDDHLLTRARSRIGIPHDELSQCSSASTRPPGLVDELRRLGLGLYISSRSSSATAATSGWRAPRGGHHVLLLAAGAQRHRAACLPADSWSAVRVLSATCSMPSACRHSDYRASQ